MEKLEIKYRPMGKSVPPRPIRLEVPGWAGSPEIKMVDGSEPQPWHCLPFIEAATAGLELLYPYETECRVINDGGDIRFDWDFAREPDARLNGGEFALSYPLPSKFYIFYAALDIKAPPGHVLRTEPHPRFFTDETGTVPAAVPGQVQTEWWARNLFIVFRSPPPGGFHVFRRNEPYAQILFIPRKASCEPVEMNAAERSERETLERSMTVAGADIARNNWRNPAGIEFNDYYKVLARSFSRDGMPGVEQTLRKGVESHEPTVQDLLEQGYEAQRSGQWDRAKEAYEEVIRRDPAHAEATSRLGIIAALTGSHRAAEQLMTRAVELKPDSPQYHSNLGELLRQTRRYPAAEAAFRKALELRPDDPGVMSNLGLALAQQGRWNEGVAVCQAAIATGQRSPIAHFRLGLLFTERGLYDQARAAYEAALAQDPSFADARRALQNLPADRPKR